MTSEVKSDRTKFFQYQSAQHEQFPVHHLSAMIIDFNKESFMTNDELHQTAAEQIGKASETKKGTQRAVVSHVKPLLGPLRPALRPFGMPMSPIAPVAKNVKVIKPHIQLKNEDDAKDTL